MKELAISFIAMFCAEYPQAKPPVLITGVYSHYWGMTRNDTVWLDERFPKRHLKNLVYHEMYHHAFKLPDSNDKDVMNPDRLFNKLVRPKF
jgi:hypothetical protein